MRAGSDSFRRKATGQSLAYIHSSVCCTLRYGIITLAPSPRLSITSKSYQFTAGSVANDGPHANTQQLTTSLPTQPTNWQSWDWKTVLAPAWIASIPGLAVVSTKADSRDRTLAPIVYTIAPVGTCRVRRRKEKNKQGNRGDKRRGQTRTGTHVCQSHSRAACCACFTCDAHLRAGKSIRYAHRDCRRGGRGFRTMILLLPDLSVFAGFGLMPPPTVSRLRALTSLTPVKGSQSHPWHSCQVTPSLVNRPFTSNTRPAHVTKPATSSLTLVRQSGRAITLSCQCRSLSHPVTQSPKSASQGGLPEL